MRMFSKEAVVQCVSLVCAIIPITKSTKISIVFFIKSSLDTRELGLPMSGIILTT